MLKLLFFLLFFSLLIHLDVSGQKILLKGKVVEKENNTPIPYASIYLKNDKNGSNCDSLGIFTLTISQFPDTLIITEVGHKPQIITLISPPATELILFLESTNQSLGEVVVMGYKDPGKALMKKVIENKRLNDANRLQNFARQEYNKMEVDLKNGDNTRMKSVWGKMSDIFQVFESDSSQKFNLPLYFNETFSLNYHAKTLQTNVKKQIGQKLLGLPTDELAGKLEKFNLSLNIYDGVLPMLKTTFLGPISAIGLTYYHFEILDTNKTKTPWTYQVAFTPKFKNENTFQGIVWIEDDSYAIQKVNMQVSKGVNINFIAKLNFSLEYTPLTTNKAPLDKVWVLKKSASILEFQSGWELLGLPIPSDTTQKRLVLFNKTVYDDYKVNDISITEQNFTDSFPQFTSQPVNSIFQNSYRLETLSSHEQALYQAIDSLKSNRTFINTNKIIAFGTTGYWDFNQVLRVGPYSSFISSNIVEGVRTRLGFWTLEGISKKWNVNAYLAYGSFDRRWKGGIGVKYVPSNSPYRKTELFFRRDYDLMTEYDDELDKDNIISFAAQKRLPPFQIFTNQIKLIQEYDINNDWSAKLFLSHRAMTPTFNFGFYPLNEVSNVKSRKKQHEIITSEIGINLRYAHNERSSIFNYDKLRIYTQYPILNFHYVGGIELTKKNYFSYHRVNIGISQEINLPPKGSFYYNLTVGKFFGTAPDILLNVPQGNASYVYSKYGFNNMNPYEFATDRYVSLKLKYSMGGLILDKIPLINKFNLRERVTANFFWGDKDDANKSYNEVIGSMAQTTGNIPYAEAGIGVENIFNFFSIDAVWRLNHLDNPTVQITKFGVYIGVKIGF